MVYFRRKQRGPYEENFMANQKSKTYAALKELGWTPDKPFVQYTTTELADIATELGTPVPPKDAPPAPASVDAPPVPEWMRTEPEDEPEPVPTPDPVPPSRPAPAIHKVEQPEPGLGKPTPDPFSEPIDVDQTTGRVWFQKEFVKPDAPRPRGRRVVRYTDPGTSKTIVHESDGTTEEYEVPGNRVRTSEAKVTLPSYQPAVYKDPAFPFRIVEYRGKRGFLYEDICRYYDGRDLVPTEIRTGHVSNLLTFDIPTTVRAIRAEAIRRGLPT